MSPRNDWPLELAFCLAIGYNELGWLREKMEQDANRITGIRTEVTFMAMAIADLNRRDELLNRLKTVWGDMSSEERSAVEVVVNSIITSHARASGEEATFPSLTERELLERIDLSIAQANNGEYADANAFEKELAAEFGLA